MGQRDDRERYAETSEATEHEGRAERERDAWRNRGRLRTREDFEREMWLEVHGENLRYERDAMEPDLGPDA